MALPPAVEESVGFATQQLHAGARADAVNPRVPPIYLTAGFVLDDFDQAVDHFSTGDGYSYTRVAYYALILKQKWFST